MRNTPRKKESLSYKDDDDELKPLLLPVLEPQSLRPQFTYLNPATGHQVHQSLVTSKMFSPMGTPRESRKKLLGESVFKTPNSRGPPSADKRHNGFATPESRCPDQTRRTARGTQVRDRFGPQKNL